MFDLSLLKIVVVLVVALFVLGPERLPSLVRQGGRWLGELRRLRESVESEVRGVMSELPGTDGFITPGGNPLAGIESPFAGLHESVSSIGDSLRSVLGTGAAATGGASASTGGAANAGAATGGASASTGGAAGYGRARLSGGEQVGAQALPADPSLN